MRHRGVGRLWLPLLAVAVVLVVWLRTTGTEAAFAVTTGNPSNSFSANPDWKPPVISAATVLKAEGGIPGYVRASGSYTVIASVVDDPSSNPPAGIGSVLGNAGTLTTGATALSMSASAQTVNGVGYTHASASQAVPSGRAAGSYSGSVTASDLAAPVNTSAAFPFTATVDNTAPTATKVAITNASGPTGKPSSGDTITYTWNETIDPWSLGTSWNGSGSQNVTVKFTNHNKGQGGDTVVIMDANNSVQLPLGSVALGDTGYVASGTPATFGGPGNSTRSTITWSGTSFTVTLGPLDTGGGSTGTVGGTSTATWTPASGAFDRAGNPSSVATATDGVTSFKF